MRKRKGMVLAITLALAGTLLLAGCGGGKGGSNAGGGAGGQTAGKPAAKPVNLTIVGGSVGGVWAVYSEGVAEVIRRSIPGATVTVEPGTTNGNPGVVSQGKAPLGVAFGLTALSAYKGTEPFKQPLSNLRAVCALIPTNLFQFVTTKSSGITSFDQIKNEKKPIKISVDSQGSAGDVVTKAVMRAYGITYDDLNSWGGKVYYLSGGKTFEMMSDGHMDGTGDVVPAPSGDILEASSTIKFNMLPVSDAVINKVHQELGMTRGVIPKDAYNFLDKDVPTLNMPVILVTTADQPADLIYQIAKAVYNNTSYLKTVAKGYKDLGDKTIVEVNGLPLHPGAEKFFKEKGLLK